MLIYFIFAFFYLMLAWLRPKLALFLLIFLLPTYQLKFQIIGLPITFLEAMILILFFVLLIRKQINITNFSKTWQGLILFWLLISFVSVFVAPDLRGALGFWRAYFLEPILFLIIFISLIKQEKDIRFLFYVLSFLALLISGWVMGQKIVGQGMTSLEVWQYPLVPTIRPTGPFPHSNFVGLLLGPLIILLLGWFISLLKNKKSLSAIYFLMVSIVSFLAIIFAKNEGAIIGVLVGLAFFFIIYLKKKPRLVFIAILLLIFCYLLFFSPWRQMIWQKISFQDLSLKLRLNIWQGTWQMIKTHPFFGVGLRGYQQLISEYQQPFFLPGVEGVVSNEFHPYPHNLFLAIWAELGILGLISFLIIIFNFFKSGFNKLAKKNKNDLIFIICFMTSLVVILVHGLVDTPYFKNDLAVLFWLVIGLNFL